MSLFNGSIRPPSVLSDEAVERYLAAIRAELSPDPLFRRRLRGSLVNRFVAAREGHRVGAAAAVAAREMGRLGRAVLYASFALGVGVTGVMAGSQRAIPGEIFYPLKLQIEEIRAYVLPAHLQDQLAAHNLAQRIGELGRLAEAGEWGLVVAHAAAVERAYEALVAAGGDGAVGMRDLVAINGLLEHLPDETRLAVEGIMDGMPGIGQEHVPGPSSGDASGGNPGGANNDGSNPNGSGNSGGSNNDGSAGNAPDRTFTDRGDNATEPTRGGPNTGPSPSADPKGIDGDQATSSPKPEKSAKPEKPTKPTSSPSADSDGPGEDESP
jgi:hypothetical protein